MGMRIFGPTVSFLVQAAVGQSDSPLFASDDPELDRFVAAAAATAIAGPADDSAAAAARWTLACLRAGQPAAARAAVATTRQRLLASAEPPLAEVAWLLIAHAWLDCATRDDGVDDAAMPSLRRHFRRLVDAPTSTRCSDECLVIQAMFATAQLLHRTRRPAVTSANRGLERLERLERLFLQRIHGTFRSEIEPDFVARRVHPPSLLRDLEPAWYGFLSPLPWVQRHFHTTLDELTIAAVQDPAADTLTAACVRLAAAAELRDARLLGWSFARVRQLLDRPLAVADAALALDAVVLALTGIRQATAFDRDPDTLHIVPWLPPGMQQVRLCGMHVDGGVLDVEIAARRGPLQDDEQDATLCAGGDRPRLVATVTLRAMRGHSSRDVMFHGAWISAGHQLAVGERVVATLPTPQLETQHEPR